MPSPNAPLASHNPPAGEKCGLGVSLSYCLDLIAAIAVEKGGEWLEKSVARRVRPGVAEARRRRGELA